MGRTEANQFCSRYGTAVGLPVPRFPEENAFYRTYFAHDELWLGVSNSGQGSKHRKFLLMAVDDHLVSICAFIPDADNNGQTICKSDDGQTLFGPATINPYHQWINYAEIISSAEKGVAMSGSGRWQGRDENDRLDSVCVFNIIPDECSDCTNRNYCRYEDGSRTEIECM